MKKIAKKGLSVFGRIAPVSLLKTLFQISHHKRLSLEDPLFFNEKLIWLEINNYNHNETVWKCSDKYLVRNYAREKGIGEENMPELLGVYKSADEINFDELPDKFALKCSHGCGYNIICTDKKTLNIDQVKKQLDRWLRTKFGYATGELHYTHIKPCIICEKFIEDDGSGQPTDYKFYCFNGKPRIVLVCTNRHGLEHESTFYDIKWRPMYIRPRQSMEKVPKPISFKSMVNMSKKLSREFPFVRIDFYESHGKPILGEMTFTPSACMGKYTDKAQIDLGKMLDLEKKDAM